VTTPQFNIITMY